MMVDRNADGNTKTLSYRKILRKTQKTTTYWKPKEYWTLNVS